MLIETFEESIKSPFESEYSIRVSQPTTTLEHCRVYYAGKQMTTIDSGKAVYEALLVKGGALNFRIPRAFAIAPEELVLVQDGERKIREAKFGGLTHSHG